MAWNIADLTEHIVDTVPERVALIVADEPRTYAQLEERANRLAHHLAAQGVGPGDHVGIYGFNSHAFVETILAALALARRVAEMEMGEWLALQALIFPPTSA